MINRIKLKLLCEAKGKHDELELLKSFYSNFQDGYQSSNDICSHTIHLIEPKLDGESMGQNRGSEMLK